MIEMFLRNLWFLLMFLFQTHPIELAMCIDYTIKYKISLSMYNNLVDNKYYFQNCRIQNNIKYWNRQTNWIQNLPKTLAYLFFKLNMFRFGHLIVTVMSGWPAAAVPMNWYSLWCQFFICFINIRYSLWCQFFICFINIIWTMKQI